MQHFPPQGRGVSEKTESRLTVAGKEKNHMEQLLTKTEEETLEWRKTVYGRDSLHKQNVHCPKNL